MKKPSQIDRRDFLKSAPLIATSVLGLTSTLKGPSAVAAPAFADMSNIIGPMEGYTPYVGTITSMMNWMRMVILMPVEGMSVGQLDYIHDANSNSIGAMLFHLAATERFYQIHTLEGKKWGDWSEDDTKRFGVASELGDNARKEIKGNNLTFYLDILKEVRQNTLKEFKKRDDKWLLSVDKDWPWGPTNNYCKWFHVCEHESNHNGQIKYIKGRLPGAKATKE
ncbi:MAG: DinB family protein [Chryseolinea sp.]